MSKRVNKVTRKGATRKGDENRAVQREAGQGSVWLMRSFTVLLVLVIIPLAFMAGRQVLGYLEAQRVELLKVEGSLANVSEADIRAALSPAMNTSLIYVDLERIRLRLEQIDWVRTATIRREWPDTLHIHVTEQRAIARWKDRALLSEEGELFNAEDAARYVELPYLEGDDGDADRVMEQYRRFAQLLYPQGIRIRELVVDERGSWTMILDNGVKLSIGQQHEMERVRRFVKWLDTQGKDAASGIARVDLRYENGIAVMPEQGSREAIVAL